MQPDICVAIVGGHVRLSANPERLATALRAGPFYERKAGVITRPPRRDASNEGYLFTDVDLRDDCAAPGDWPDEATLLIIERGTASAYPAPRFVDPDMKIAHPASGGRFYEVHLERVGGVPRVVQLTIVAPDRRGSRG